MGTMRPDKSISDRKWWHKVGLGCSQVIFRHNCFENLRKICSFYLSFQNVCWCVHSKEAFNAFKSTLGKILNWRHIEKKKKKKNPRKKWRHFAWNVKSCFLGKIGKNNKKNNNNNNKKKTIINLSSAELAKRAVKVSNDYKDYRSTVSQCFYYKSKYFAYMTFWTGRSPFNWLHYLYGVHCLAISRTAIRKSNRSRIFAYYY